MKALICLRWLSSLQVYIAMTTCTTNHKASRCIHETKENQCEETNLIKKRDIERLAKVQKLFKFTHLGCVTPLSCSNFQMLQAFQLTAGRNQARHRILSNSACKENSSDCTQIHFAEALCRNRGVSRTPTKRALLNHIRNSKLRAPSKTKAHASRGRMLRQYKLRVLSSREGV